MPTKNRKAIGLVTVAYGNANSDMQRLFDELMKQKGDQDFFVLIDNHPSQKTYRLALEHPAIDEAVSLKNPGFGASCNEGFRRIPKRIDRVCFLNPDTEIKKGTIDSLAIGPKTFCDAWMPLIVTEKNQVNSAGNVLHVSGMSWCDGLFGDPDSYTTEKTVTMFSGACFVMKRHAFQKLGGFYEDYFLYHEDTDLAIRANMQGMKIVLDPNVRVVHDYVFEKGGYKYYFLERNRYFLIFRTFPVPLIVALSPLFFVFELGFWLISIKDKRFTQKLKANLDALRFSAKIIRSRVHVRRANVISTKQFLDNLMPIIQNPLLGVFNNKVLNLPVIIYVRLARLFFR